MPRLLAALAALLFLPAIAAAQVDVIRGRVTNAEGLPLPNVRVTATSIPGSVTREVRTNAQGAFQIAFPNGTGDYMMGYALIGYVYRQFQLKRLADEDVLIGDARLSVVQLDTVRSVETTQQKVSRNERDQDVSGTQQAVDPAALPPGALGDVAAMAASLPGVLLVPGIDGGAGGFSVYGLGADQNSVTLNGLPIGANGLPRDAAIGATLTTSPYDATRGGFSGGQFEIRSNPGGNYSARGLSLVVDAPQLQWTDAAARALGAEYTNLSFGGMASGPLTRNRTFYNASWQLGRRLDDATTLLRTSDVGLRTAGIAADSVTRFVSILEGRGIPVAAGVPGTSRTNDNGSLMGSLDWSPGGSTSGHSFNVTANGNWSRQRPVGISASALSSAGGERTNWSGSVRGRHSGYVGMLLSESSAGVNLSRNGGSPYVSLPAGRVRVNSVLADGLTGVQSLAFGGNQGLSSSARSAQYSAQNTLSWFDGANKHRLKLTTELEYSGATQDQGSNLLGTFAFNSLADLEAGRPASFTRTLTAHRRTSGSYTAAVAINDSYRRSQDVQFQYGVRVDRGGTTTRPPLNPALAASFGVRNDRVPAPLAISPRLGFSWTVGRLDQIESYFGESRAPRAVVRGGIGLFANSGASLPVGAVLDNTGLPGGVQQVVCVGPAAPIPDWQGYDADASLIPTQCADGSGGSVFSNASPSVTLFARGFRPQRSVRSNLSWSGAILDARFNATFEGSVSLNLNQQRSVDLNFEPHQRFTLDDGRPVYVEPTSIVATTGAIASRDARRDAAFNRVSELRSDLRSRTAQLSVRLSPIQRGPQR
ncbi:MAG TPA: TonB-dependent receptor, partial [Gemmatimonadaceae bacterium]